MKNVKLHHSSVNLQIF